MPKNIVPQITPMKTLDRLLRADGVMSSHSDDTGALTDLKAECLEVIEEIEKTVKEVGGDKYKSTRYLYADALLRMIRQMEGLNNGNYTFSLAATKADQHTASID